MRAMRARIACVAVAVTLFGAAGSAQTTATLLQKGIYTHDTLGDLDAAIHIYEQVIAAAPPGSGLRTQAERRLSAAMAQRKWAIDHPKYATLDGRTYRHHWTGTTFDIPQFWTLRDTGPSSDGGEMATIGTDDAAVEGVNVWMKKEATPTENVAARLDGAPIEKVEQRLAQGYADYRIRDGSIRHMTLQGQRALFAIGDYVVPSTKRPMAEYLMWIYTTQNRVFFFSRMPAERFDDMRIQIDTMVQYAVVF